MIMYKRVFAGISSELATPGYFLLNQRGVNDILGRFVLIFACS